MTTTDEIIELAKSNRFPFQIAEQLNVKRNYVSSILSEARKNGHDIPKFTPGKSRSARGAETYERVIYQASLGLHPLEIAGRLNIGVQTVYQKIKQARENGIIIPQVSPVEAVKRRIPVSPKIRTALEPHASIRGLTPIELGEALIRAIVENDLVNAVLDDGAAHDL